MLNHCPACRFDDGLQLLEYIRLLFLYGPSANERDLMRQERVQVYEMSNAVVRQIQQKYIRTTLHFRPRIDEISCIHAIDNIGSISLSIPLEPFHIQFEKVGCIGVDVVQICCGNEARRGIRQRH